MQNDLISRSALDSFFYSETSGTDEMIEDAVMKYPDMEMEFSDDCRALCKDIIEMCRNVIKTEPIAYDMEKTERQVQELADALEEICKENAENLGSVYEQTTKRMIESLKSGAILFIRNGGKE